LIHDLRTLQVGDDWITERQGGLGRYYYELLRHLPATGTAVHGLVVGSPEISTSTGGEVEAFARPTDPLPKRLWMARKAAQHAIASAKTDLIVSHFALYGVAMPATLPSVVHFHGPWAAESMVEGSVGLGARIKGFFERNVYTRARRLIVLSKSFEQELVRGYSVPPGLVRIVPGGIDTDRFHIGLTRGEARTRLGWPQDRPILLTVRRQVRRMGLEDLIDAVKLLVAEHPDLLLLLGGSGPIAGDLQQRIEDNGLSANVRLLGRISDEDLPMAYRAADFSVVPSQSLEGFGLITLESLASGTPVFVTPIGGLPEIVEPFAPQCVFTDTTSAEMADRLGAALAGQVVSPTEEECRAYALGFAWRKIAERVRAVYKEALG
jgi:glycogen(starch) synthase